MSGSGSHSGGRKGVHAKRVTPVPQDGLRRLIPRALLVACLAGGTCAALAAGRHHPPVPDQRVPAAEQAPPADPAGPLRTADVAHAESEPLPRRLVVAVRLYPSSAQDPSAAPDPARGPSAAPGPTGRPPAHAAGRGHHHRHRRRSAHAHRAHHGRIRHPHPFGAAHDPGRAAVRLPDAPGADPAEAAEGLAARASGVVADLDWQGLAHCEAGGRPTAVDPTGTYGGLYQFDVRTWHAVGGRGRPEDAPATEQTRRAMRLYRRRGAEPWPVCGSRLFH